MAYEIDTVYSTSDRASFAGDLNNSIRPMVTDAGAKELTGWDVLTGPMAGGVVITSRWKSLDTAVAWMAEAGRQAATDGDMAKMAGRYQLLFRGAFQDLAKMGKPSGLYRSAARFSIASAPAGLDHALQIGIDAGANGGRAQTAVIAGDMTGQLFGNFFYPSLDGFPTTLAATSTDRQFTANAAASTAQLLSRTIFQRV
jgi:hypothetical protein